MLIPRRRGRGRRFGLAVTVALIFRSELSSSRAQSAIIVAIVARIDVTPLSASFRRLLALLALLIRGAFGARCCALPPILVRRAGCCCVSPSATLLLKATCRVEVHAKTMIAVWSRRSSAWIFRGTV